MTILTLTKLAKLEWDHERPETMYYAADSIVADLMSQKKTDGTWTKNEDTEFGGQMAFVNQAAAEEYIAAVAAVGIAYGRILVNSSITDI